MKLSQFTVVVNDYPKPDQHLLYNTLSRTLIQVDKTEWDVLQNLSKDIPIDGQAGATLDPLRDQGFLVPKELKEGERFLEYLNRSPDQKGGEVSVTLLTNLQRCPLACEYCYQQGTHDGERLEGDLSDECLAFIKEQCEKVETERLFISYYGSEPLSNLKAIVSTATELKQFCEGEGDPFPLRDGDQRRAVDTEDCRDTAPPRIQPSADYSRRESADARRLPSLSERQRHLRNDHEKPRRIRGADPYRCPLCP